MPQTKSAKRAVRVSKRRTNANKQTREAYKDAVKLIRRGKGNLSDAYRMLDRAAKNGVIHAKKAARLKSRLSRGATQAPLPTKSKSRKKKKIT